jgi:hypothetical protein
MSFFSRLVATESDKFPPASITVPFGGHQLVVCDKAVLIFNKNARAIAKENLFFINIIIFSARFYNKAGEKHGVQRQRLAAGLILHDTFSRNKS